jgi:hypothetical protein
LFLIASHFGEIKAIDLSLEPSTGNTKVSRHVREGHELTLLSLALRSLSLFFLFIYVGILLFGVQHRGCSRSSRQSSRQLLYGSHTILPCTCSFPPTSPKALLHPVFCPLPPS